MRKLVTAADVKNWAASNMKTAQVEIGTIITPAARDAARDYGIEIIEGVAACRQPAPAVQETSLPDVLAPKALDQAIIARIVEEILVVLEQRKKAAYETDACGFKLVRGEALEWGDGSEKVKVKQVFDGKESPNLFAGMISLSGDLPVRQQKGSEIHFLQSGTVSYRINGREFSGKAGDMVFLPAGAQVGLGSAGNARIFYVACPDNWWQNCSN